MSQRSRYHHRFQHTYLFWNSETLSFTYRNKSRIWVIQRLYCISGCNTLYSDFEPSTVGYESQNFRCDGHRTYWFIQRMEKLDVLICIPAVEIELRSTYDTDGARSDLTRCHKKCKKTIEITLQSIIKRHPIALSANKGSTLFLELFLYSRDEIFQLIG